MILSDKPTEHILLRAGTNSEWDSCDFAIVSISRQWVKTQLSRLDKIKDFADDPSFHSLSFYDNTIDFYQMDDTGYDIESLLAGDWAFVELHEEETATWSIPENTLDACRLMIFDNGDARYRACGKHTGETFFSERFSLRQLTELWLNKQNQSSNA